MSILDSKYEVIVGIELGYSAVVGEEFDGVGCARGFRSWHINFVITVVLQSWTYVVAIACMVAPTGPFLGAFV